MTNMMLVRMYKVVQLQQQSIKLENLRNYDLKQNFQKSVRKQIRPKELITKATNNLNKTKVITTLFLKKQNVKALKAKNLEKNRTFKGYRQ